MSRPSDRAIAAAFRLLSSGASVMPDATTLVLAVEQHARGLDASGDAPVIAAWRSKMPGDKRWLITADEPTPPGIIKEPLYTRPPVESAPDPVVVYLALAMRSLADPEDDDDILAEMDGVWRKFTPAQREEANEVSRKVYARLNAAAPAAAQENAP